MNPRVWVQNPETLVDIRGSMDMDGCQNYGPFLDPDYNTAPNI